MPPRRGQNAARLVTLSSDLGAAYAAQMKAVLVRSVDPARVVDLVHDLPRHGIAESAFVVRAIARLFPAGTVHLVVVDPGVGGARAPIAIACRDGSRLVGPDNGVLLPLAETLGGVRSAYRIEASVVEGRRRIGTTFDGRDQFAPAAARLANGSAPSRLGGSITPRGYRIPEATRRARGAEGEVVHVDRFGNLITNVPSDWIPPGLETVRLTLGRAPRIAPWVRSYETLRPGSVGALGSSFGTVEVAVREGDASGRLGVRVGARVSVRWERATPQATEMVNSERRK